MGPIAIRGHTRYAIRPRRHFLPFQGEQEVGGSPPFDSLTGSRKAHVSDTPSPLRQDFFDIRYWRLTPQIYKAIINCYGIRDVPPDEVRILSSRT